MIRVRKIEYIVYMDVLDGDGNVTDELSTQKPLVAWAHQLDQVSAQVAAVAAQAEAQTATADNPPR